MFLSLFLGALPTVFAMEMIYGYGMMDMNVKSYEILLLGERQFSLSESKKSVYVFAMQWTA